LVGIFKLKSEKSTGMKITGTHSNRRDLIVEIWSIEV